jgi:hypothetical protein
MPGGSGTTQALSYFYEEFKTSRCQDIRPAPEMRTLPGGHRGRLNGFDQIVIGLALTRIEQILFGKMATWGKSSFCSRRSGIATLPVGPIRSASRVRRGLQKLRSVST